MSLSGVLIGTTPANQEEVRTAVDAFAWAEVHHADPDGRLIATVEGDSTEAVITHLKTLKALPGVVLAEMVMHCFEEEAEGSAEPLPEAVAEYLNDDKAPHPASHFSRLKALGNH